MLDIEPFGQSQRLRRVLDERREAEAISPSTTRWTGFAGVAMAALALVPGISVAIPFSAYCLAAALAFLATYVLMRRATERRSAALGRRSPFDAIPPAMIVAFAGSLFGVLVVATISQYRVASIVVAAAMLTLAWIAWRIALSQASLSGNDSQLEYAVDERLRAARDGSLGTAAMLVTYTSFAIVVVVTQTMIFRDRLKFGETAA
jgi:hypothetical protein